MNEEKDIKSSQSGFSKENPFKVPEGYFENVQSKIDAQIEAEEEVISRKVQVLRILRPALSLAASFAIVFLLVYYPLNKFLPKYLSNNNTPIETESISEEDFLTSLMDDNSFFNALTEEELEESLSSDEVYAYLSAEMTEYDLYNEIVKN